MSLLFEVLPGHQYAIGIDPGSRKANPLGLVVVDITNEPEIVYHDWISAKDEKAGYMANLAIITRRLEVVTDNIQTVDNGLKFVAFERPHFQKNPDVLKKLSYICGVIYSAAIRAGAAAYEVQPMAAKNALSGYGGADDAQMQAALKAQFGLAIRGKAKAGHIAHALGCVLYVRTTHRISQLIVS
jgi:Holliday junction resolvasome RuvABC endonuclease subunit